MNYILAREVINNGLLILDVSLMLVIFMHFWHEYRVRTVGQIYSRLGNQAAIALLVLMAGHTILRGTAWLDGRPELDMTPYAIAGGIIALAGMACAVRIFSWRVWGEWGWVGALVAALVFILVNLFGVL